MPLSGVTKKWNYHFFLIIDHLVIRKSLSGDVKKCVFHITNCLVM